MLRLPWLLLGILLCCQPGYSDPEACAPCPVPPPTQQWERPTNQLSASSAATAIPALLKRIFIAVSFSWNTQKVVHLQHMLEIFLAYPTATTITVICNVSSNVHTLLAGLGLTHRVSVWDHFDPAYYGHHKYGLLYEHRFAIGNASLAGGYTTYIYVEDDTRISWPALVSWALDTEMLEPLGYLRNFYRTEHSANGELMWLDLWHSDNLAHKHVLRVALPPGVPACTNASRFQAAEQCAHEYYYRPTVVFMGMWVATHGMLQRFMASRYWTVADAQRRDGTFLFGYPERSTGMIMLVPHLVKHLPAVVVPFYPEGPLGGGPHVAVVAAIAHSRNGYAHDPSTPLGKLAVVNAMHGSMPPGVRPTFVPIRGPHEAWRAFFVRWLTHWWLEPLWQYRWSYLRPQLLI